MAARDPLGSFRGALIEAFHFRSRFWSGGGQTAVMVDFCPMLLPLNAAFRLKSDGAVFAWLLFI